MFQVSICRPTASRMNTALVIEDTARWLAVGTSSQDGRSSAR
jgi:hypothetical protein